MPSGPARSGGSVQPAHGPGEEGAAKGRRREPGAGERDAGSGAAAAGRGGGATPAEGVNAYPLVEDEAYFVLGLSSRLAFLIHYVFLLADRARRPWDGRWGAARAKAGRHASYADANTFPKKSLPALSSQHKAGGCPMKGKEFLPDAGQPFCVLL